MTLIEPEFQANVLKRRKLSNASSNARKLSYNSKKSKELPRHDSQISSSINHSNDDGGMSFKEHLITEHIGSIPQVSSNNNSPA